MGGSSSAPTLIQAHIKSIKSFMHTMSGNPLFSNSLQRPNALISHANSLNYFCFFTKGKTSIFRYWQLKQFFVCSFEINEAPIKQNNAIVHRYKEMTFLSIYLDPVAFSNMITYMDNVPASFTRNDFISRMSHLYKNQDPLLGQCVSIHTKIRTALPTLRIAEPVFYGQSLSQSQPLDENSSSSPSNVRIDSDDVEIDSEAVNAKVRDIENEESILISSENNISSSVLNPISEPSSILRDDQYSTSALSSYYSSQYSTTQNSTTGDSATEYSTTIDSTTENSTTNDSATENSTTIDSTTENSTTRNSTTNDSTGSASDTEQLSFSSFANSISEPGPYESSLSITFKELKNEEEPYLHKHHNLNNDSESSVTVSESFLSQSTIAPSNDDGYSSSNSSQLYYSSSSHHSTKSHSSRHSENEHRHKSRKSKVKKHHKQEKVDNDDSYVSNSESIDSTKEKSTKHITDRNIDSLSQYSSSQRSAHDFRKSSSVSSARKLHIFTDENDDFDENDNSSANGKNLSFVTESVMSSNGVKSSRKRNVGVEINLQHNVGFTSSEASFEEKPKSSKIEKTTKNESFSSNRSSSRGHKRKPRSSKRPEYSSEVSTLSIDAPADDDTISLDN